MNTNILQEIRDIKIPVNNLYAVRNEYKGIYRPDVDVRNFPFIVKIVLGIMLYLMFYNIYNYIYDYLPFTSPTIAGIGLVAVILLTWIVYQILEMKINQWQINYKVKTFSVRIARLIKDEEVLVLTLKEYAIPLYYCYPHAIQAFENYVVNGRADTVKECINLYEQDRQNQRYMEKLESIQDMQEDIYQEAQDAKFWSMYSMFSRR